MPDETSQSKDMLISLKFEGPRILPQDVVDTLQAIEDSLKEGEIEEIRELCDGLGISPMIRDAVLYRLKEEGVGRFYIEAAKPGSLELLAIIAAATYFVLQKTLGESVKEGYLTSDLHAQVKEWIAKKINEKMRRLARDLPEQWRVRRLTPKVTFDEERCAIVVVVLQQQPEEDLAPTYKQMLLLAPRDDSDRKPLP